MCWVLRNATFSIHVDFIWFEKKTFTFKKLKFYENVKQIFDFDHNFDFPDHFLNNNNNNKQWYVINKQCYVTTTRFYFKKCNCFY